MHHTAVVDEPWDGPAAEAAMPNDKATLHYCHAWEAPDASDEKSGYKFPHAKKKGGPANLAACRNGLARLDSADIPDADRAGVKAHLQAHLDDADKGDDSKENAMPTEFWARAVQLGTMTNEDRIKVRAARAQKCSDSTAAFYRFTNTGDVATLDINDEIGFWGVCAADFSRDLDAVTAPAITVRINSPGGDVFDGIAMTNLLRAHPATVNTVVYGLAASAASIIAQAGDTVTMMPGSQMMIHDASGVCMGNAAEMRDMAELLDKISDNLAGVYAKRAGGTAEEWRDVMRGEQWYTAEEAVKAGLADEVAAPGKKQPAEDAAVEAVENRWNLSFYNYDGRASAPAPHPQPQVAARLDEADMDVLVSRVVGALQAQQPTCAAEPAPTEDATTETPSDTTTRAVAEDEYPTTSAAAATAETAAVTPTPVNTWDPAVFRARMKERAAAR